MRPAKGAQSCAPRRDRFGKLRESVGGRRSPNRCGFGVAPKCATALTGHGAANAGRRTRGAETEDFLPVVKLIAMPHRDGVASGPVETPGRNLLVRDQ